MAPPAGCAFGWSSKRNATASGFRARGFRFQQVVSFLSRVTKLHDRILTTLNDAISELSAYAPREDAAFLELLDQKRNVVRALRDETADIHPAILLNSPEVYQTI